MQLTYRFSELHLCHHTDNYFIPFQVLTKFRSISSGDLVTYSEVLKLNLSEFIYNEELKKAGFEILENTTDEITDTVKKWNILLKMESTKKTIQIIFKKNLMKIILINLIITLNIQKFLVVF
jgi:hypothetical protein